MSGNFVDPEWGKSNILLLNEFPQPFCVDPWAEDPDTDHAPPTSRRDAIIAGNAGLHWWRWALETNQPRTPRDVAWFKQWMHRLADILGFDGPSVDWFADWKGQFEAALAGCTTRGASAGTHEFAILRIEFEDERPVRVDFVAPFLSHEAAEVWIASPGGAGEEDCYAEHHIMEMLKGAYRLPIGHIWPFGPGEQP